MELVLRKLAKLEQKIDSLTDLVTKNKLQGNAHEEELMFKGVNVRRMHAANPYAYGLQLMDVLFTKEELAGSLMFESGKSNRSPLDKERVNRLFKMIEEKYKDDRTYKKEWDMKVFVSKANQKCRDAQRLVKTEDDEITEITEH